MQYNLLAPMEQMTAAQQHSFWGTSCYQHAIGYPRTIISTGWEPVYKHENQIEQPRPPRLLLGYIALQPGMTHQRLATTNMLDLRARDVDNLICQGCVEEGMQVLENTPPPQSTANAGDQRLLGLYLRERDSRQIAAFHFIRQRDDGKWDGKFPHHAVETYDSLPREIDGYRFARFILAPKHMPKPVGLAALNPQSVTFRAPDRSTIYFDHVPQNSTPFQSVVFCDIKRNMAFGGDPSSMYTESLPPLAIPPQFIEQLGEPTVTQIHRRPSVSPAQQAAAAWRGFGLY